MTYSTRIEDVFRQWTDAPALLFDGRWIRWGDFAACAARLRGLPGMAGSGEVVAIIFGNRPECVAAFLTAMMQRSPVLLFNALQPPAAIAAEVVALNPACVLFSEAHGAPALLDAIRSIGASGIKVQAATLNAQVAVPAGENAAPHYRAPDGAGIVMTTSGTTGPAKRIPFGWDRIDAYAAGPLKPVGQAGGRTVIVASPITTITGLRPFLAWAGKPMRLALLERLDLPKWLAMVREFRPREAGLPPAAMRMLLDSDAPADALSSLEGWYTGAAAVDPAMARAFETRFGVPVLLAYGATEFGGPVTRTTLEDRQMFGAAKAGASGRAMPDVELRIVDQQTGAIVGPGQEGLLEVRTDRSVTPGPDGWTRTNDLARIDEDGFLYIQGRVDDVINRGGFKVSLNEIEAALLTHPDVQFAAPVDLPDPRLGAVPAAAVILYPDRSATSADLRTYLRERIAAYKIPVLIEIVDDLPRTPSMKVRKADLRAMLAERRAQPEASGA